MSTLDERRTPQTDAWVARLAAIISPAHGGAHGRQSELARHLCAVRGNPAPTQNDITRWVSQFSRWFRRKGLPGLEDYLTISAWLETLKTPAKSPRREAAPRL